LEVVVVLLLLVSEVVVLHQPLLVWVASFSLVLVALAVLML
jgi:hypothetical protein